MLIQKRDGKEVTFDREKIVQAIKRANDTVDSSEQLGDAVINDIANAIESECQTFDHTVTVEEVQDMVILQIQKHEAYELAKEYITYRYKRSQVREYNENLIESLKEIISTDSLDSDRKRENGNIDGDTAMGTMLQIGSTSAKYYNSIYLIRPEHNKLYREGWWHIHDFDFYPLTVTCCQIDLIRLFKDGFSTGHGFLREPQSIGSYAALAAIAIQADQNDCHGGQSVPNFDYSMAEGVRKTFAKAYRKKLAAIVEDVFDLEDEGSNIERIIADVSDAFGELPRLENSEDFDKYVAEALVGRYAYVTLDKAVKDVARARKRATIKTDRDTYQAMEGFVHNLNTMHSRAGAQVPFSSINYGTDTSPEGRMVIRNVLMALDAGMGHGETCIFPIHIFKVKEGVNYNPEDPNYDLFKLSMKVSARRLFPNYVFIDAPYNLQYYKSGHPETEVATMGCRTRVMGNVYDPTKEIAYSRGNLSFTSINLPRIGIEAHGDEKKFYALLDQMLEGVAQQLLDRFEIQARRKVYNFPFLIGQGVWLDSDKLGPYDEVREVLKHGTLSIGFIGLAETLTALYGHHHGEGEEYQKKGLEIIGHMREFCDKKSQELKMNFSLLATPAEGLSGRFVRMDKERYGIIPGVTDKDYYTNSNHIPPAFEISAADKIRLEAPYHALCNAGHICYVELDGDTAKNVEAFEAIIRCMHDNNVGYGSINHPVDRDPVCGYVGVIGDTCPRCGRHDGEAIPEEKLAILRKQFPYIPAFKGLE